MISVAARAGRGVYRSSSSVPVGIQILRGVAVLAVAMPVLCFHSAHTVTKLVEGAHQAVWRAEMKDSPVVIFAEAIDGRPAAITGAPCPTTVIELLNTFSTH